MVNYTIGATALLAITLGIATAVNATENVEQQHQNLRQQNDNNEESTSSTTQQQKQRKVSYYRYGGNNDAYLEDDEEYSPFGGMYGSHHHKPKSSNHADTDNSYQDKTNKPAHHHDVVKVGDAAHDKWTADGWESSNKKWYSHGWDKKKHDDDDDSWKCTHKPHKRWSSSSSSWDIESSSKLHTIDNEWSSSSWSSSSSGKSGKSNSHHGKSGKSGSKSSSSSSYDNPNGWGNISTWGSWSSSSSSSSSGKSGKSGSNSGKSGKSGSNYGKSGKSGRWSMNKTNRAGWSSPTICHTDSPTSSPSVETQELIVYYSSEEGRLTAIEQATEVSHDVPDFKFVSGSFTEAAIAVLEDDSNIESIEEDQTIVLDPIDDSYYPDDDIDDITDSTSRLLRNGFSGMHNHRNLQTEACDGDNRTPCVQLSTRQSQGNLVDNQTQCRKKVCILDTGYDRGHVDLPTNSGDSEVGGTGTCNNCPWFRDDNSHGTHVAGTVAAVQQFGRNPNGSVGTGVVGIVEKGASLYIVRVFQNRSGSTSAILDGLSRCRQNGGDIVNMSLGGGRSFGSSDFQRVYDEGLLLVAAAGNSGNTNRSWPASESSVISVASTNADNRHSSFSQYNNQVELAAFGKSSLSTLPNDRYGTKTGTSMASPVVAGVAAVVWSTYPQCTNVEIRNVLRATAVPCAGRPTTPNNFCGYGIVQAEAAVDYIAKTPSACQNRALCPSVPTPQPPPTKSPTDQPTKSPTNQPTDEPTQPPTISPTTTTPGPTVPPEPSNSPTREPTSSPVPPTSSPTRAPSSSPSQEPTRAPVPPTSSPTRAPSSSPSRAPSNSPVRVTPNPTRAPSTSPTTTSPVEFVVPDPTVVANDDRFTVTCDWTLGRFPVCNNGGRLDVLFNDEPSAIRDSLYIETVQTRPQEGFGNCDIGERRPSSGNRAVVVYTPGDDVRVANNVICEYTVCIPNTLSVCDTATITITLREKIGVKIWNGGEAVEYQN